MFIRILSKQMVILKANELASELASWYSSGFLAIYAIQRHNRNTTKKAGQPLQSPYSGGLRLSGHQPQGWESLLVGAFQFSEGQRSIINKKSKDMDHKKIWQKVVSQNEEIKHEFSLGKTYLRFNLIVWLVLGILLFFVSKVMGILLIASCLFYFSFYLKTANAFAFTNRRVLVHRGWLSTSVVSIDYKQITDVTVVEPLLDRLFTKSGHLAINTAGSSAHEVILKHIASPYEVKKKLDQLRD